MINQIKKSSLILAAFAIVTTAVVTVTYMLTAPQIKEQQRLATLKTLDEIIDKNHYNNLLTSDCTLLTDANNQPIKVFRARKDEQPKAAAIETIVPDGYNGRIDLLVAVDTEYKVTGVRTVKHMETPGLGDKIEIDKADWIEIFNGKSVDSEDDKRWAVRKDGGTFDQFTGATITPRAVVKGVKNTVLWYKANETLIFEQASNCLGEE